MLVQLHIENIALINQLDLRPGKGLNVLTGETGAGKSIVIDAVNLVLGGRASGELIRDGADKAIVEALFSVDGQPRPAEKLAELGFPQEEDGSLLLTREIARSGKNICRVNGRTATLSMFREVGNCLVDIYGQHEHQSLTHSERHMQLLDQMGDPAFQERRRKAADLYGQWREVTRRLTELKTREKDYLRQMDLLGFQLAEIDEAGLHCGEEEELQQTRQVLAGAEKLSQWSAEAYGLLKEGSGRGGSVLELLAEAVRNLRQISGVDASVAELAEMAADAFYRLEEAANDVRDYRDGLEFDPGRLEQVESRLAEIGQLKRKYGDSIAEILAYREQAAAQRSELDLDAETIEQLSFQAEELREQGEALSGEISEDRAQLAQRFTAEIQRELRELGMPQVRFAVDFRKLDRWTASGLEEAEFLISPNPGEVLKPLAKIASGGEMSRIMLAFKTVISGVDAMPTLIFDEIDAGIGGRAALAVGEKLALVGRDRQVICVTHSPQVSSFAGTHFLIEKTVNGGRTATGLTLLDRQGKVKELARMLGGQKITDTVLKHAEEMLNAGTVQSG